METVNSCIATCNQCKRNGEVYPKVTNGLLIRPVPRGPHLLFMMRSRMALPICKRDISRVDTKI